MARMGLSTYEVNTVHSYINYILWALKTSIHIFFFFFLMIRRPPRSTLSLHDALPISLNGRSWTDLAALQPGVDTIQTQPTFAVGADRGNRGFGQQLTISGARPQQNNYRLDGVSLNDYANGASGSVLGGNLGVDAIQEFSVLTSNYSAEYGKTSGGVVNAITRSGTNTIHGSAYEFLRNST